MALITKEEIKSIAEKYYDRKSFSASDIASHFIADSTPDLFKDIDDAKLRADVSHILNRDIKLSGGMNTFRNGKNKNGKVVKTLYALVKRTVPSVPDDTTVSTLYLGKAGEYAVLSELLLRGYNANNMTIDDGIDIVASKNNIVYYYQVKTTAIDNKGCAYPAGIKLGGYDSYIQNNMRYIFVIRTSKGTVFLGFGNSDIQILRFKQCIREDTECIYLKFRFDEDGKIYAYHGGNSEDVSWSINKF